MIVFVSSLSSGVVNLGNVTSYTGGSTRFEAESSSTINLSQLPSFFSDANNDSQLVAMTGGSILTSALATITDVELRVSDTATVTTTALTNANGSDLIALSGGTLALSVLTSYRGVSTYSDTLETDGAGSVLDLTHLTTLTGATNFNILYINANGGTVKLGNVTTDGGGTIRATANGGTIDFSQLPKFFSNSNYDSQLVSENGGHILTPVLTTISDVELVVRDTATLDTSVLSNLTEVDLYAQSGGTLALPAVTSYSGVNFASDTFETDNAGSVLDLTHLTTLTGRPPISTFCTINANGGTVKLGNVTTDGGGTIRATANGGTIDFSQPAEVLLELQLRLPAWFPKTAVTSSRRS